MGIEQREHDEYFEKKKKSRESQRSWEFFEEKRILLESSRLRKKLAQEIATEFGVDSNVVELLLRNETHNSLTQLQDSLGKEKRELLSEKILSAIETISNHSKKNRERLKDFIQDLSYKPEEIPYHAGRKILGDKIYNRATDPENFSDQLIGAGLGIIDSTEATIIFVYFLGKGIILTPYHLYLHISGKSKIQSFHDIW